MFGNSRVAERLEASEEGLGSMELVSFYRTVVTIDIFMGYFTMLSVAQVTTLYKSNQTLEAHEAKIIKKRLKMTIKIRGEQWADIHLDWPLNSKIARKEAVARFDYKQDMPA
jgi:hypothetical protein